MARRAITRCAACDMPVVVHFDDDDRIVKALAVCGHVDNPARKEPEPMDALTAYSYVRMEMPAGARLRTIGPNPSGVIVFEAIDDHDEPLVLMHGQLGPNYVATVCDGCTDAWPWASETPTAQMAIALGMRMAAEWRDTMRRRAFGHVPALERSDPRGLYGTTGLV
jgi:hypothetical protein